MFAESKWAEGKENREEALGKTEDIHDAMVGPHARLPSHDIGTVSHVCAASWGTSGKTGAMLGVLTGHCRAGRGGLAARMTHCRTHACPCVPTFKLTSCVCACGVPWERIRAAPGAWGAGGKQAGSGPLTVRSRQWGQCCAATLGPHSTIEPQPAKLP